MLFDTYQMVHSLTKAEKRYFQRTASLHTIGDKNTYLKLFEALNRQKKFDETEIVNTFRGNLYLLKRHLYKSILKSIHAFHAGSSTTIRVHSMISEVDILHKKGLTKAALKLLHHAKKIAGHDELHLALAQLFELEIKILSSSRQLVNANSRIKKAFHEAGKQIELYGNFQSCFQFRMNVGAVHNKEIFFRNPIEQKKYEEEIRRLSEKDLSEKAKWQLYNAAGTYFSTAGNYDEAYAYHKKASAISEKKSFLVSDDLREYILSLYTQGVSDYYLKRYNAALGNLKDIHTIFATLSSPSNQKNMEELYLHSLLLEGFIRMDMAQFEKARPVILQLKKEIDERNNLNVSLRNDIYYQQSGFWFYIGNFKEAELWITKMLQDEDAPKENPARYAFARLMQLLVLLELREFRQIENLLPATKKFLRRKQQYFKTEEALLSFISNYARSKELHSEKYTRNKFSELKKKLARISKDKNEAASLRVFDYIAWAKAKMQNKTMAGAGK